jgi:homoserine dehydrogenase
LKKERLKMEVNVGIIGFGNVGQGTAKALIKNRSLIEKKTGIRINLKTVADIKIDKLPTGWLKGVKLTKSADEIIEDEEIQIVAELIGGIAPAKDYIIKALKKGKRVVTANKAVLANYWDEIQKACSDGKTEIKYEASAGGVIPVIESLEKSLVADDIIKIYGVLNGTTNYILSNMEEKEKPFEVLLKEAQKKGYAEANPYSDISGEDAAFKIFILTLISGKYAEFKRVHYEGIDKIMPVDFKYAHSLGYTIKLLAVSDSSEGKLDIFVRPMLVPLSHPLATLKGSLNKVVIRGRNSGETVYEGYGAGGIPTGVAVASNIVSLAVDIASKGKEVQPLKRSLQKIPFKRDEERVFRWYIRFVVKEGVGIIHKLSGCLARYGISIKAIHQEEVPKALYSRLPFVITVHKTPEPTIKKALKSMEKFPFLVIPPLLIPFLEA